MVVKTLAAMAALLASVAASPVAANAAFPGANGPLVAAVGNCSHDRYLVSVPWRGGEPTPITPRCPERAEDGRAPFDVFAPDASPDGRMIIAREEGYEPDSGPYYTAFTTMAPDGSDRRRVNVPPGDANRSIPGGEPAFAPTGGRFAFTSTGGLWSAQTDGSDPRPIGLGTGGYWGYVNPRWSPDGKLIAVTTYSGDVDEQGIWLIRASDGTRVRRVVKRGDWADWSPDGKHLVYGTYYGHRYEEGGATGGNIYVVPREAGRARKLVHRENIADTEPVWSPDGRWIAFLSMRFGRGDLSSIGLSIWRVRASGGKPKKIRGLPGPNVDGGYWQKPSLAWLPRPR